MPNTLAGITVSKFFDPFYSNARARLHLSASEVDEMIAAHCRATISGHDITFTYPNHVEYNVRFRIAPRTVAAWVNKFNMRSGALGVAVHRQP